jgi:hypothetical protein
MRLRFRRGIELPVNAVIIIALAIFVLLMIAAFFSGSGQSINSAQVNTAFNEGCSQLSSVYSCNEQKMSEIKTSIVVNGQAKSLLEVCRMSFNNPTMSALKCKFACQTCQKYVYENSPCEEPDDTESCSSPLTADWKCTLLSDGSYGCRGDIKDPNTQACPPGSTNCQGSTVS